MQLGVTNVFEKQNNLVKIYTQLRLHAVIKQLKDKNVFIDIDIYILVCINVLVKQMK